MKVKDKPIVEFLPHGKILEEDEENNVVTLHREPWEETLSDLAEANTKRITIPRSPDLKRKQVVNAFLDAFQLIGGTPRLAIWADENPTEFYRIYSRLIPQQSKQETEQSGGLTIRHVLPRGVLDE